MRRVFESLAAFPLCVALITCGVPSAPGDGDGGQDSPQDNFSFKYTAGSFSGTFAASGEFKFDANGTPANTTMAAAWIDPSEVVYHRVVGQRYAASSVQSASILFYGAKPGESVAVSPPENCKTSYCIYITIVTGTVPSGGDGDFINYERVCRVTSGTIKLDGFSNGRMRGTFSGVGTCLNYSAKTKEPFVVADGSFNLSTDVVSSRFARTTAPTALLPAGEVRFEYNRYFMPAAWALFGAQGAAMFASPSSGAVLDGTWAYGTSRLDTQTGATRYGVTAMQVHNSGAHVSSGFTWPQWDPQSLGEVIAYSPVVVIHNKGPQPPDGQYYRCLSNNYKVNLEHVDAFSIRGTFVSYVPPDNGIPTIGPDCAFRGGVFNVPLRDVFATPF